MNCCRRLQLRCLSILGSIASLVCLIPATSVAQTLLEELSQENPQQIVKDARAKGDIVRGAILFHQGNINCAKCHRPAAEASRIGPDLEKLDQQEPDEFIVESILYPSRKIKEGFESYNLLLLDGRTITGTKVRENDQQIVIRESPDRDQLTTIDRNDLDLIQTSKTSSMPDDLVTQLKNRQQFLDLVRYVIDLKERNPQTGIMETAELQRSLSAELQGLVLIQKLNCNACHDASSLRAPVAAKSAPRLAWSTQRLNPNYLKSFVAKPAEVKPGSTMPSLLDDLEADQLDDVSTKLTHFLLSKAKNQYQPPSIDAAAVGRGFELFHSVGCVACHAPRDEQANEQSIADSMPLGDVSQKYDVDGLTEFLETPLASRPSGHMPNMQLTHFEAIDIANFLLQSAPSEFEAWQVDPQLATAGQTLFIEQGCIQCHTEFHAQPQNVAASRSLDKLKSGQGCLSETPGAWPDFHLDQAQRDAISAALQRDPIPLDTTEKIDVTLAAFNCTACHVRDNLGGVTADRQSYFHTTNLNLGDQGRIPPTLTGVGAKLKSDWMRDVMVNGRSIRPYMKTRMPQFGEPNIQPLIEWFQATDQLDPIEFTPVDDAKKMRELGHQLVGNKGLNCVACHTYQYKPSDTMPAVDLTEMAERLHKDWFYQYMLQPQKFSPNTVMPSFWPGGKAIRPDLEGSAEYQLESMWQYLLDGRQARAPAGVVREPLEIVVADEARMLRRSYPGIGKRGIGVGYPGDVNLAFDAEQMRLGSLWRGKFVEASGVWRGQGSGNVRPLGNVIQLPTGPELDHLDSPWVVDEGRPPEHQFRGYRLDDQRRPTFQYSFGAITVEDYFEPFQDQSSDTTQLRRTITLRSERAVDKVVFRIAAGDGITVDDDAFIVSERWRIRTASEPRPKIVTRNQQQQLLVPVELSPDQPQTIVIEYVWQ